MSQPIRACPACGHSGPYRQRAVAGKEAIGGGPLVLAACPSCGASFQPRTPTPAPAAAPTQPRPAAPIALPSDDGVRDAGSRSSVRARVADLAIEAINGVARASRLGDTLRVVAHRR